MNRAGEFDTIVVGAGSAGCALAARLSEDGSREVLVLEQGPTYERIEGVPVELLEPSTMGAVREGHPHFTSFPSRLHAELSYAVPRGRGLGGCSALNAGYFLRGTREDFDHWAALGLPEWSFDQVLPFYVRSETDHDFRADYHGRGGPVPVRRSLDPTAHPLTEAFHAACLGLGHAEAPDQNAPGAEGVGPVALNVAGGVRHSAGVAYLLPNLERPNLRLRGRAPVRRVLFEGTRAVGVEVGEEGEAETVRAEQVVLCAGAVKSPHLLLLSGVGPADQIAAQGLRVLSDLPGVGAGLSDHPEIAVGFRPRLPFHPRPGEPALGSVLSFTAPGSAHPGDLELMPYLAPLEELVPGLSPARAGELSLRVGLQQPASRGELRLRSADPSVAPAIDYGYLAAAEDRDRLRHGVRAAVEVLARPEFDPVRAELTDPAPADLASERSLDAWIRSHLATAIHMSGTCRMGPREDAGAVLDGECRVRGVEGLRVVDTSIMPRITSRGPSATATMIGERAAGLITR